MRTSFGKAAIVLAALAASGVADAKTYRRSCDGAVVVTNDERNMVSVRVNEFSATASAGGYMPNTIRLRAYRKAVACLRAAWALRDGSGPPPECDEAHGITGFDIGSWPHYIARRVCPAWSSSGTVHVTVIGKISGDNGCGGDYGRRSASITLGRGFEVFCP